MTVAPVPAVANRSLHEVVEIAHDQRPDRCTSALRSRNGESVRIFTCLPNMQPDLSCPSTGVRLEREPRLGHEERPTGGHEPHDALGRPTRAPTSSLGRSAANRRHDERGRFCGCGATLPVAVRTRQTVAREVVTPSRASGIDSRTISGGSAASSVERNVRPTVVERTSS